jgi:zinc protease
MTRMFIACLLLILASAQCLAFEVESFTTPKGIHVWHVADNTIPLVSMDFAFASGTLTDAQGKEGTTYLLSQLLDEGAGSMSGEAFRELRDDNAVRLRFNAAADYFTGSLQTPTANSAVAFNLLRIALTDPQIAPDALERVRQQAIVSAQGRSNSPYEVAIFAAGIIAMPGHPYLRFSQGDETSLQAITRDDVLAVRDRIITRKDVKVTVVGDIARADVEAAVDRIFGSLPETGEPVGVESPATISTPATKVLAWDMPQTFLLFGSNAVPDNSPDYRNEQVLLQIVGGENGRLTQELREKRGLTYGVSLGRYAFRKAFFSLGAMGVENARAGEALSVLRDVLRKVAENGVTQDEVDQAKLYLKGSFAFNFETSGATSGTLLTYMTYGLPPDHHKKRNVEVDAARLEDINSVAKRLLDPQKLIVVAIGKPVGIEAK